MGSVTDQYIHEFLAKGWQDVANAFGTIGDKAGRAAAPVGKALDALAGMAPMLQQAGQRGLQLSNDWSVLGAESAKVNATFDSLASKQGLNPEATKRLKDFSKEMIGIAGIDDEETLGSMSKLFSFGINDVDTITKMLPGLAASARDYGISIDDVGKMVGKAVSAGNVGALTKSGLLTMDFETRGDVQQAQAMLKSSDAATYLAGQQKMLGLIMKSLNTYASDNAAFMATSAGQMQKNAVIADNLKENLGQGVNQAKAFEQAWKMGVLGSLGLTDEASAKAVGGLTYVTSEVATLAAGVGNAWRTWKEWQIALKLGKVLSEDAAKGKKLLGAATAADALAEKDKTGIAKAEGEAISAVTGKVNAATLAKNKLAKAGGGGFGGMMTGGLGLGGLLGSEVGAIGGLGAGAIATSVLGALAAAGIGWTIGSFISKEMDKQFGYIDKWSGKAVTESGPATQAEIDQGVALAHKRGAGNPNRSVGRVTPAGDIHFQGVIPKGTVVTQQQAQDYARNR